jgi:hypothetical protein
VKILDQQDERPPLRERRRELRDGIERSRLHHLGGHATQIHRDAEKVEDVGAALGFVRRRPEAARQLRLDRRRRIGVGKSAHLTDQRRDREVGRRGAVRDATRLGIHRRRRGELPAQLEHQPRLADARLADDGDDMTIACQRGGEAAA